MYTIVLRIQIFIVSCKFNIIKQYIIILAYILEGKPLKKLIRNLSSNLVTNIDLKINNANNF